MDSLVCAYVSIVFKFLTWENSGEDSVAPETSDYCHLIPLMPQFKKLTCSFNFIRGIQTVWRAASSRPFLGVSCAPVAESPSFWNGLQSDFPEAKS